MTRAELAKKVHETHGGMTYQQARQTVETVLALLSEGLCRDGRLLLSGFGTFKVVERKARTGRDLGKGSPVRIPTRKTVVFVPSRKWVKEASP